MIASINYGMGNFVSVQDVFKRIVITTEITAEINKIEKAEYVTELLLGKNIATGNSSAGFFKRTKNIISI